MTPKEKAKELIDSFRHHTRPYNENYNYIDCIEEHVNDWESYYSAINCALIAADEIIEIIHSEGTLISYGYWNDVKQELLNLKENKVITQKDEPKQFYPNDFGLPKFATKDFNDLASNFFGGKPNKQIKQG